MRHALAAILALTTATAAWAEDMDHDALMALAKKKILVELQKPRKPPPCLGLAQVVFVGMKKADFAGTCWDGKFWSTKTVMRTANGTFEQWSIGSSYAVILQNDVVTAVITP